MTMKVYASEADGHDKLTEAERPTQHHKCPLEIIHKHETEKGGLGGVATRKRHIRFTSSKIKCSSIRSLFVFVIGSGWA